MNINVHRKQRYPLVGEQGSSGINIVVRNMIFGMFHFSKKGDFVTLVACQQRCRHRVPGNVAVATPAVFTPVSV